ncbi:MAG TPA: TIGR03013 family XrtA/PEP-CTERM system glycosyltransferase [Vicinamibacteria bacterium]|nr:TIGR03013 family XrtA/PEP-CTERM system glycosyltransferase [Vicinamibacteria bacterium]
MGAVFVLPFEPRKIACALIDTLLIVGTFLLAARMQVEPASVAARNSLGLDFRVGVLVLVLLLSAYYNELYQENGARAWSEIAARWLRSALYATVLMLILYSAAPDFLVGRQTLLLHFPMALVSLLLWHSSYDWVIRQARFTKNVAILGTGRAAQEIARLASHSNGYRVVGLYSDEKELVGQAIAGNRVIGTLETLTTRTNDLPVDVLVVALEDQRGKLPIAPLLRCRTAGVRVMHGPSFYEHLTGRIPVRSVRPSWLIFSPGFNKPRFFRASKRVGELLLTCIALLVAAPVLVLAALAVWLESGRPVFYRQERVGKDGHAFELYKLRTMRVDAEKDTGPVWASPDGDPRITRVGGLLRKSRLDELPQLLNILKGEMSFVGPRPERPCFVEQLRELIPYYDGRHSVKPGITGWAQVRCSYGSTVDEAEQKLQYDLFYIKNMSFLLDAMILLETVKVMIAGKGAR